MKNREIKVTVGIPVYNASGYIEKTIKSVLCQTLGDIELIIVDDKGKDNSMEIIKQIIKDAPRGNIIRIIDHGINCGVAYSRNTIMKEAKGKYLFYMDQDDFIIPEALALMYERAEEKQAETVWGSYKAIVNETGEELCDKERIYEDIELIGTDKLILYECRNLCENMQHTIWNILFLASFLRQNKLQFEQHGYFDDTIMHARMQPLIKRAVLLSRVTYVWNIHAGSGSNFQYRDHFDIKEAIDAIGGSHVIIEHCKTLSQKSYFDIKCAKVMKQAFFTCCGILKHRHQMDSVIENHILKEWLQHPASLRQICLFKHYRMMNFFFWFLGKLPADIMVAVIVMIGKKKGYI